MDNLPFQQAAATVASAMRRGISPPDQAELWLSLDLAEAKDALIQYGATSFLRRLSENHDANPQPLSGQNLVLYKAPQPGEQQAKLSYEYLLEQFTQYLRRKISAVVTSESPAHLALWLPEGVTLDLPELWQAFITEMTSPEGFSKGFGLVMNSSKLSDRGFGTLETPMVSESQPLAVASFYLANLEQVRKSFKQRQSEINAATRAIAQSEDDKERQRLEKQRETVQAKQDEEQTQYAAEFVKTFGKLLEKEHKKHEEIRALEQGITQAEAKGDSKTKKKLEKKLAKLTTTFVLEKVEALQSLDLTNPFVFMDSLSEHEMFRQPWQQAKQTAKRFTETAANQLRKPKDTYVNALWETCVLLFGEPHVVTLEPLLQEKPILWQARSAGDDAKGMCYSCGRPLEQGSYDSRRLAFQSPYQRAQSANQAGHVKVCHVCAALSILSPVKFAPDTLVIRFSPSKNNKVDVAINDLVQQALERQALNEIGAVAGRYINLTCTEKLRDGTLAVQKLGMKQYATAKLASLYSEAVLRHLQPYLYDGGQEIALRLPVLVATAILTKAYRQRIQDGNEINMKLGEVVRLLERDAFIEASYVLAKVRGDVARHVLENGTALYVQMLKKEQKMNDESCVNPKVQVISDVHAIIGLLLPFCRQIRSRKDLDLTRDERIREIGKLIQSIDENPTVVSYNAGKLVGGVGYLVRDNHTHFVFDEAKELIGKLGEIPEFVSKSSKDEITSEEKDLDAESEIVKLRVTTDLIARAFKYVLQRDIYCTDYDLKNFFYQVRLGLSARFPEVTKSRTKTKGEK